jgi:formylmethanofuran dehydrogenase subunit E
MEMLMPSYLLSSVKTAVKKSRILFRGYKVRNDINNLEYSPKELKKCLMSLTEKEFNKTITYSDEEIFDVYKINYEANIRGKKKRDELYIKLRLVNGSLTVELASFHQ